MAEEKGKTPQEKTAELKELKAVASILGITYAPNATAESIQKKIAEFKAKTNDVAVKKGPVKKSAIEAKKEAEKLVRAKITCMNPNKKTYQGEYVSAGNAKIGFVKKFVLFNEPFHVPQVILNVLKEKKYQRVWTKKVDGRNIIKTENTAEYAIEILPPLTKEELDKLAQTQRAKGLMGDD